MFGAQDGGLAQYSYVCVEKPHTPVVELQQKVTLSVCYLLGIDVLVRQ